MSDLTSLALALKATVQRVEKLEAQVTEMGVTIDEMLDFLEKWVVGKK